MASEARAWWADVEHLRETAERRADGRRTPPAVSAQRRAAERWTAPPAHARRTVLITGRPDPGPGTAGGSETTRSRSSPAVTRMRARPDRIALWAVVLGIFLVVVAAWSAHAATHLGDRPLKKGMVGRDVRQLQLRLAHLGFLHAPATARFGTLTRSAVRSYQRSRCLHADGVAGAATVTALRAGAPACSRGRPAPARGGSRSAYLHSQLGTRTLARGMAGSDVRTLQRLLGVSTTGLFGAQTKAAVRRFQARAGLGADGAVGPATRTRLVAARMRPRMATYYGPGLYGRRTACGLRLTSRLVGVAHRRLPCGATVTMFYGGRFATLRVVDRGPYTSGVTFDLTAAAARRLGMRSTATLRAAY